LAGDEYQRPGGALTRLVGESLKNTDYGAISGENSDPNYGYSGESHHNYNQ